MDRTSLWIRFLNPVLSWLSVRILTRILTARATLEDALSIIPLTGTLLLNSKLVPAPTLRLSYPLQEVEKDNRHYRSVDLVSTQFQSRTHSRWLSI